LCSLTKPVISLIPEAAISLWALLGDLRLHQLRFNQVLQDLIFQRIALDCAGNRNVDHGIGDANQL
jgi:hypothetical protein